MAITCLICSTFLAKSTHAAVSNWRKGFSIYPTSQGDFDTPTFRQSVDAAATTGANYIGLIIPLYQSNTTSIDIQAGSNTPTDASLTAAVKYIHGKGMNVMFKPHIDPYSQEWRAYINPPDREGWFSNYTKIILHYAQLAQQNKVEAFCIGSELIGMSTTSDNTNTQHWYNIISSIRAAYPGMLTYSGNWGPAGFTDEKNHIAFWNALDYIGISAYFELKTDNQVQSMQNAWAQYNTSDISPLSQQWNKPVLFTEIGYQSKPNSQQQPWNFNLGGGPDTVTQQNAYEALFSYWNNQNFMQGVTLWDWSSNPNAGGSNNTDYTPQGKLAQKVITNWFTGNSTPPPTSTPPSSPCGNPATNAFTACYFSDQNLSNPVLSRTETSIHYNWGDASPDPTIPADHFSARWEGNFNFNSGAYTFTTTDDDGVRIFLDGSLIIDHWQDQPTPTYTAVINMTSGIHTVRMDYYENRGEAEAILFWNPGNSSGGTPINPPSTKNTIQVWWPIDGSTISGIQPFKALLPNTDIASYSMSWQVDGGKPVPMFTNTAGGSHKESTVDVSPWTWHGRGPYAVTFSATDLNGNLLAQKTIKIFVSP